MGSKSFQSLNPFPISASTNYLRPISPNNLIIWRCFSGGRSGGSRWNHANVNLNRRSRLSDAYLTDDCDDEGEFGFQNAAKKRVWWSDVFDDDDDDDDEEEVEEGDVGFGLQEYSVSFKWIWKVLRSFGWMIPAVITSLVLGTETDSIFVALALPIAQSVFSLITETLWKRSSDVSRTKSKSKKRTRARTTSNTGPKKTKGTTTRTRLQKRAAGDYISWLASSNVSAKTGKRNSQDFGGWDELDNQAKGR